MSSFRKLTSVAALLTAFTSVAYGQASCGAPQAATNIIRAEGTTEQVAPLTFTCTAFSGATSAGTASLQLFLSPAVPVTSKVLNTSTAATEAVAVVSGNVTQYNGTVSGSTVHFDNFPVPALAMGGNFTVTVSNIRVNATVLSTGAGVPPAISITPFISGGTGTVIPAALPSTVVAFAQQGLGVSLLYSDLAATTPGSRNFSACNGYDPNNTTGTGSALAFVLQVRENFTSAFRSASNEAAQVATSPANSVAAGTRLTVTLTVPPGVSLYVPVNPIRSVDGTGTIQQTVSAAGSAFSAATAAIGPTVNGLGLSGVPAGTVIGSVAFEITADDFLNLDRYNIPVYVVTTANAGAGWTISASVSFAPLGSTTIPNFVTSTSSVSLSGSTFSACQAPQSISFSPPTSVPYGAPFTLSATASSGLPVDLVSNTPSVCLVGGSALTLVGLGSCSVTASQPGNASYLAATPVTQSVTVTQGPQTITFAAINDVIFAVGRVLQLTGTASSGYPVSFVSNTEAVCRVVNRTAVVSGAGTCTITASQAGSLTYLPANAVTQSFTVSKASQIITFAQPADTAVGLPAFVGSATASSSLAVEYASSTATVCAVTQSTITALGVGTCTITASQTGDVNYLAATPVSRSFNVSAAPTVSFSSLPTWGADGPVSGKVSLGPGIAPNAVQVYIFQFIPDFGWVMPSGCSAASLNGNGAFSVLPSDQMYRYVTRFTAYVLPASAPQPPNCQQGVAAIPQAYSANAISSVTVPRLAAYETLSFGGLRWFVKNAPLRVWPDNKYFATQSAYVDNVGRLHLTITPCPSFGGQWCAAEIFTTQNVGYGTYNFSVASPLSTLDANVTLGMFTWDAQASSVSNREWDIEVSKWGNANATTNAQYVVQPYTGPNNLRRFNIATSSQTTHSVVWNPTSVAFNSSSGGSPIDSWSYQAGTGLPPVPTPGDVRLHLNLYLNSGFSPNSLQPQEVIISQFQYDPSATQQISLAKTADSLPVGGGSQSAGVNGNAGCSVTAESDSLWLSALSGPISPGGAVQYSAASNGGVRRTGNIILTSTNCNTTVDAQVLTITQAGAIPNFQSITFLPPGNVVYGSGPIVLLAAASSGLPLNFFSSTQGVCTTSGGVVSLLSGGTCAIIASQPGNADYGAATPVTRSFLVTAASQTITFAGPANTTLGLGPVQVAAAASSGLPLSFVSGTTGVCTVSGATVTLLGTGTCSITALQGGNLNYQSAQVTRSFEVGAPGVDLTVGSGFGVPAQAVELPIQLSVTGGVAPVTFQMDLGFDAQKLAYVASSARPGPQSAAAGKSLSASTQPDGSLRLLVSGLNQTPIAPGVVAYASFRVANGFLSGSSDIAAANCRSASADGASLGTNCSGGTMKYAVCDINADGAYNVADVQLVINEALGVTSPVHDLNGDALVTVADVQIVINSALSLGCVVR
ncbi:MAG: hypothetical protein JWN34_1599 [Bryobacterales bacterium]|nr:hypothetical protein [Bryobacterales bacterium]